METKKDIRKRMLAKRDAMKETERMRKSSQIFARVEAHPYYQQSDSILCYVSFRSEVDTSEFMKRCLSDGKAVYCPKVIGDGMEFFEISSLADLRAGYHGIWEPPADETKRYIMGEDKTLMIVPGAVFDRNNHRIGYGGGYYDGYLAKTGVFHKEFHTIAVAYAMQVLPEIPWEEQDIAPELIITEEG